MVGVLLSACGGGGQSVVTVTATPSDPVVAPSAEPSEPMTDESDPVVEPEESEEPAEPAEPAFKEVPFGESLSVSSGGASGETVTLSKPTLADCQYESIGCDDPEVGDRVVQIGITIKNDGSETAEWGNDFFILEFADGTQMAATDGASFDYWPDNHMDYDVKVRPGSTFKSVLVFEAPKGPFKVLLLSDSYDGEPIGAWY